MLLNFEQKDPMFLNNAGMSVEKCVQLDLNTYLNVDCYKMPFVKQRHLLLQHWLPLVVKPQIAVIYLNMVFLER